MRDLQPAIDQLRTAVELLERIPPVNRLRNIERMCFNHGGRWDGHLSHPPSDRDPLIFEIVLFGVPAMAESREEMAKNWLKAANATLKGIEPDEPDDVAA